MRITSDAPIPFLLTFAIKSEVIIEDFPLMIHSSELYISVRMHNWKFQYEIDGRNGGTDLYTCANCGGRAEVRIRPANDKQDYWYSVNGIFTTMSCEEQLVRKILEA